MKKSEMYYIAQVAVIEMDLNANTRLEVLRELMARQDLEVIYEKNAEKEADVV